MSKNKLQHIAFIMDGNGRWANQQNKPRIYGHQFGLLALKQTIKNCYELNIPYVSFFCFSTENWTRPKLEVDFLIKLFSIEIKKRKNIEWLNKYNIRLVWNGLENNLDPKLLENIKKVMVQTQSNTKMVVQLCFNYGSHQSILEAINQLVNQKKEINLTNFNQQLNKFDLAPIDLLIRTGGEYRISNFMLWEISYSELIFNPIYWPDYNKDELLKDIDVYYKRNRRFGGL